MPEFTRKSDRIARVVMIGTSPETQGGISTVVNVLDNAGLLRRCDVDYIITHRDGGTWTKVAAVLRTWPRFIIRLLRGRVAMLHAHTSSRASFWRKCLFIVPAILVGTPVVLHLHAGKFHVFYSETCSASARRFVRWVFEHARRVVVLSESWRRWAQTSFPAANIMVIPNPVGIPVFSGNRLSEHKPATLLFLGRLGQGKGAYDLLQAVAQLVPRHPGLRLLMGGDGELEAVRAAAQDLHIGANVELLGWVPGAEKTRLLNEASLYVLPSYNEGLPMSVLEAMAHGLPVVSTPVGGIPEAVSDGVEGFLVEPGDVVALADRLDRLLADPALRVRMGLAARKRAETDFCAGKIVERWVALYSELGATSQF